MMEASILETIQVPRSPNWTSILLLSMVATLIVYLGMIDLVFVLTPFDYVTVPVVLGTLLAHSVVSAGVLNFASLSKKSMAFQLSLAIHNSLSFIFVIYLARLFHPVSADEGIEFAVFILATFGVSFMTFLTIKFLFKQDLVHGNVAIDRATLQFGLRQSMVVLTLFSIVFACARLGQFYIDDSLVLVNMLFTVLAVSAVLLNVPLFLLMLSRNSFWSNLVVGGCYLIFMMGILLYCVRSIPNKEIGPLFLGPCVVEFLWLVCFAWLLRKKGMRIICRREQIAF